MQYIKIGHLKIPCEVRSEGNKKILKIFGFKLPFYEYKDSCGQKYYKILGVKLKSDFKGKIFLSRRKLNFQNRDVWEDKDIRKMAEKIFMEKLGYEPDFDNPKTMNEKIFWMKLNYHDPLVTTCCDKFRVKEYVRRKIGEGLTVPVIDSFESADDIDFDRLPDRFVLKVNWSSGFNIIVKDKNELDRQKTKEKLDKWLRPEQNSYYQAFNWGYKDMKPVIYAEEYIEQIDGQLYDYKFYCCNGKAKFLFVSTDRFSGEGVTYDFFDMDFNRLDLTYGGRLNSAEPLKKPQSFDEMIKYAEILAQPFPFVRVDFYEIEGRPYVGEMTFYSGGGILPFEPVSWDYKLGEYIQLPIEKYG